MDGLSGDSVNRDQPDELPQRMTAPPNGTLRQYRGAVASTRPTLIDGVETRFAEEALESFARQVQDGFIPITVEHFSIAPPHGVLETAKVIQTDDGYQELVFEGGELPQEVVTAASLEDAFLPSAASFELQSPTADEVIQIHVSAEPRNYDHRVWEDAIRQSPVVIHEHVAWSALPPLEWLVTVALIWSGGKFIGAYVEAVGKDLGTAFASWIRDLTSRSKNPERLAFVTLSINLPDGRSVFGFLPFSPTLTTSKSLSDAMQQSTALAEAAVAQQDGLSPRAERMGFLFHDGDWRLGWVATRHGVLVTEWWSDAMPDPKDFLDEGNSISEG
jgi:hypothetical protein